MTREQMAERIEAVIREAQARGGWIVGPEEVKDRLFAALAAPVAARAVPESFSMGVDRHNAAKAWLDGYDTAQRGAVPVAAEPPSLVALVQEWQAAESGHDAYEDDLDTIAEQSRRINAAYNALLAWTPAQAEPAAPLDIPVVAERLVRDHLGCEDCNANPMGYALCDDCVQQYIAVERTLAHVAALPASSPAAPEMPEPEKGDVITRVAQSVMGGRRNEAEITAIERNGRVIWRRP